MYLSLWKLWAITHPRLIMELALKVKDHGNCLTDRFARDDPYSINQARALAQILNEWFVEPE
jgi:hypothetical protein